MKRAFSLIEVVIAIGIFAFAVLLIFSLLPVGLTINRESKDESFAINAVAALINDRLSTPASSNSRIYQLPSLASPTTSTNTIYLNDEYVSTGQSSAVCKVSTTVVFPETNSLMPYLLRYQVSWPATAATPRGHIEGVAAVPNTNSLP